MNFIASAKAELVNTRRLIDDMQSTLADLPQGRLHSVKFSGKNYYYLRSNANKEKYIGTEEHELVQKLKARRFAEYSLSVAKKDEKLLCSLIKNYEPFSPEYITSKLPRIYRTKTAEYIEGIDFMCASDWAEAPYPRNSNYAGQLTHLTLKGDFVRSKSEAIIANLLFSKNIPYRYEEEISLGSRIFAPDFIIAVPREGRIKILEHAGMISDRDYRNSLAWKVSQYIAHGFMPLDNLFLTYDDIEGNINTKLIESIIDTYFV